MSPPPGGRARRPSSPAPWTEVETEARFGIGGRFTVETMRGPLVTGRWDFPNLVTDGGLDFLGTGLIRSVTWQGYLAAGTGSAEPAATQSALGNELARTNVTDNYPDAGGLAADQSYGWRRITRVFSETQANGNLTELGFFRSSTKGAANDVMFNRALIRDAGGNPTVITKVAGEKLRVTYEYRIHLPAPGTGTMQINGVSTALDTRRYDILNSRWSWDMLTDFGAVGGRSCLVGASNTPVAETATYSETRTEVNGTAAAYVPGTYRRDVTVVYADNVANFTGGIGCFFGPMWDSQWAGGQATGYMRTTFDPKIPKDALQKATFSYRVSWGRLP